MAGCGPQPPFMRTLAPNGSPWAEYVKTGPVRVDPGSGVLSGPWAECVCWGVRFERSNDWQRMPEYASGDGPVGGVLSALEASLAGRPDAQGLLEAAGRLEEAAHSAAEAGQPQPTYGQQYGGGPGFGYQPAAQPYEQQQAYASAPPYGQHPYQAEHAGADGPTLLQQQGQYQGGTAGGGMGDGAKMAMAAAGGVAAGVGAYYLATHMDDVGDALGDAAGAVGHAGEEALGFADDAVEDVVDFVEEDVF